MSPAAAAEEGTFRRLLADAELTTMLGSGTRVFSTWPGDTLTIADTPRITFYTFGPAPKRPGFQRVRVTLDLWVWPSGTTGGRPKLLAIDERILAMFDEQHWSYGGYRIYSTAAGFRDAPGKVGSVTRRTRDLTLEASPLLMTAS